MSRRGLPLAFRFPGAMVRASMYEGDDCCGGTKFETKRGDAANRRPVLGGARAACPLLRICTLLLCRTSDAHRMQRWAKAISIVPVVMPLNPYAAPFVQGSGGVAAADDEKSTGAAAATTTPKIFCDLDGCLVDFEKGCKELLGETPDKLRPKIMWRGIAAAKGFCEPLIFFFALCVFESCPSAKEQNGWNGAFMTGCMLVCRQRKRVSDEEEPPVGR